MAARKTSQKPSSNPASGDKATDAPATDAAAKDPAPAAAPEDKAATEDAQEATLDAASALILVITAPRARRRAGIAFGPDPVRIPVDDLTEDQVLAIDSDRLLTVRAEKP
ncbi:hypothetical protein [Stappia sp.]|uniref:hypothetical protein n=1 Tax=Stappia sp. TaxID=1870903 RepID=UPI003A99A4F8